MAPQTKVLNFSNQFHLVDFVCPNNHPEPLATTKNTLAITFSHWQVPLTFTYSHREILKI